MHFQNIGRHGILQRLAMIVVVVGWVGIWAPMPAQRMYSIQVGAYSTIEEAQQACSGFSDTCSPTFTTTRNDSTGYEQKVWMGHFSSYAEAWVYKTQLGPEVAPGNFIVSWDYDGRPLQTNQFPLQHPFQTDGLVGQANNVPGHWDLAGMTWVEPVNSEWLSAPVESLNRDQLLAVGLGASGESTARPALERFVELYSGDAESNRIRLRLARIVGRVEFAATDQLLNVVVDSGTPEQCGAARLLSAYSYYYRKDYAGSYERFREAANNPAHAPTLRRDAMRRAAAVAHKLHRYPEAWLAFGQIEESAADVSEAAEARMQRAGLALELVGRGKGRWEEARALCASVTAMPGVPRGVQATAALMHFETYYHENRLAEALDGAVGFMELYPDCTREYRVAQAWRGIILAQLHRLDEALVILEEAASTPIDAKDTFAGLAPRARAALWLAWVADLKGNHVLRDQWVQFLEAEYPQSPETSKARGLF